MCLLTYQRRLLVNLSASLGGADNDKNDPDPYPSFEKEPDPAVQNPGPAVKKKHIRSWINRPVPTKTSGSGSATLVHSLTILAGEKYIDTKVGYRDNLNDREGQPATLIEVTL